MNLSDLKRIKKLRHITELSEEEMITEMGLYDSILIDTIDIRVMSSVKISFNGDYLYDEVSEDVKALHRFLRSKNTLELPCSKCGKSQPFYTVGWDNPRISNEIANNKNGMFGTANIGFPDKVFRENGSNDMGFLERISYHMNCDNFTVHSGNESDDETHKSLIEGPKNQYLQNLAEKCMNTILDVASEVRKDYRCAKNPEHCCFVGFVLEKAVSVKPEELMKYENRFSDDEILTMTKEEQEAYELYRKLKYCIVMRKVCQFPSMADMQLFDIEKYRRVLGTQHRDYRMAMGLYSCGVGAGAFVYLRRILENIVEDVHLECADSQDWNEEEYKSLRFNDKIDFLEQRGKEIIPLELHPIKNKLYGVISKGVHQLSEDECNEIFLYVKDAIDVFLDAKIAEQQRKLRIKDINARIQRVET